MRTIRRIIKEGLTTLPPPLVSAWSAAKYLLMDGTYLKRNLGIFVVMEYRNQQILYGRYNVTEGPRDLRIMLEDMYQQGLRPTAVTTDGNPALIKLLREVWPRSSFSAVSFILRNKGCPGAVALPKPPWPGN